MSAIADAMPFGALTSIIQGPGEPGY